MTAVVRMDQQETKAVPREGNPNGEKRPRRPSFDMQNHQHCCDGAPPLLSSADVKSNALWKHSALRPNVYGLYASACGHKGSRRSMEDRHRVVFGKGSRGFFAVYDGHGGQETADFAMHHLHKYIRYGGEPESAASTPAGQAHGRTLSDLTHAHIPPQPLGAPALSLSGKLLAGEVKDGQDSPATTGAASGTDMSAASAVSSARVGPRDSLSQPAHHDEKKEDKSQTLHVAPAGSGLALHASSKQQEQQAAAAAASAGAGASGGMVKGFRARVQPGEPFKREIERAFARCEDDVLAMSRKQGSRDGSTAATIWVFGDTMYCGNLGDSRIVLCRGGQAVSLTRDHKPADPEEKQRIIAAGGEVRPVMKERPAFCCFKAKKVPQGADRLWPGGFSVSRALGDIDYKDLKRGKVKVVGTLSARPDVTVFSISKDDAFVIVATDGFWDVMTNQEACDYVLKESKKKEFDPDKLAEKMVNRCFQLGSEDNISAVIVFFTHHGEWRTDQC